MTLTYAQAQTFLLESLGSAEADLSALTLSGYINRAGQAMVSMHAWNFMLVPPVSIDLTDTEAFAPLPADWGRIIVLWDTQTRSKIEREPLELVARKRAGDGMTNLRTYAVSNAGHASGAPTSRLELSWTPGADVTGGLQLTYRRRWSEVTTGDTLGIPHYCEALYLECLAAVGRGWEEADEAPMFARIEALKNSMVFTLAATEDGELSSDLGALPVQRPGWFTGGPRASRVLPPP